MGEWEMGRWGDGENGRLGDWEIGSFLRFGKTWEDLGESGEKKCILFTYYLLLITYYLLLKSRMGRMGEWEMGKTWESLVYILISYFLLNQRMGRMGDGNSND